MRTLEREKRDASLVTLMNQISAIMKEQNVSQAEMARRMNTHPATVNKALSLKVDPLASTVIGMLKALDRNITMTPTQSDVAP